MTLRTQMAADVVAMMNADEFAEPITYLEPGTEPKPMMAIVQREPPEIKQFRSTGSPAGGTTAARNSFQVHIANDEILGMTTVRKGQDKIELKRNEWDEDTTEFVVSSILSQDPGGWHLEVVA